VVREGKNRKVSTILKRESLDLGGCDVLSKTGRGSVAGGAEKRRRVRRTLGKIDLSFHYPPNRLSLRSGVRT